MTERLKIFLRFASFFVRAKTKFKVHSPFVYSFIENVLDDTRSYYVFAEAEGIRERMLQDRRLIQVTDLGAGTLSGQKSNRTVRSIAQSALSSPWQCRILFKIIQTYRARNLLELGSSLGISAIYLSGTSSKSRLVTLEGCPEIARLAKGNFNIYKRKNIELQLGPFSDTLPLALKEFVKLDFAFIDGNHKLEPTLEYFDQILDHLHPGSILILDDIHWSSPMEKAWNIIKQHPKVTLSIDLFFFGVLFFRKEQIQKEHFLLVPTKWKPWQTGFF